MRLMHCFGNSAQFWLNLQAILDLRVAQSKAGKVIGMLPTLERRGKSSRLAGMAA